MTSRLLLMAILAGASAPAWAQGKPDKPDCDIDIQELGEAKVNRYNALDGGDYVEEIRLRLRNNGDVACAGRIEIDRISGSPELMGPHGEKLRYTIVDSADYSRTIYDPVANTGNSIAVSVPANSMLEVTPRLFVPGSQAGRSGRYAATLEARFVPAGQLTALDSARFNVSAQVTATVQANFVGSTNPRNARLDLGELEPNKQGSIGLQVRSSSDYQISFRSDNRGRLEGPNETKIPYSLTYSGLLIDLAQTDRRDITPFDPVHLQTNMIQVTVGDFTDAPAGNYRDRVTITISAL